MFLAAANDTWIGLTIMQIMSLVGFGVWFSYWKKARIIEDTPTAKVRSAAQGFAELMGRCAIMENRLFASPLTGTPCTWFSYKIEREVRDKDDKKSWKTVASGESKADMLLDDGTGHCTLTLKGAEVESGHKDQWIEGLAENLLAKFFDSDERGNKVDVPAGVALEKVEVNTLADLFGGALFRRIGRGARMRYTESRILPGDDLYALGFFSSDRSAEPPTHQLTKPQDGRPYLLSNLGEGTLAKKLRRTSVVGLLMGIALQGVVVWIFLSSQGMT